MLRVFISAKLPGKLENRLKDKVELLCVPLIKTLPLNFNPLTVKAFSPDVIVFSSKNGVKHFFSRINPEDLSEAEVICVGKSTAKAVENLGLKPKYPEEFSAKGLIEMFKNKDLTGKRFLTVRPKVANKEFVEFLKGKGALVEEIIAYETVPDLSQSEKVLEFFKGGVQIAAFTSPSNFKSFLSFVHPSLLEKTKLIPIGTTTKKPIEDRGFKVYGLPEEFSLKGIVEMIEKIAES
jgi:uroporphyrinogen-III synthase